MSLSLHLTAVSLSASHLFLGCVQKTKAELTETKSQKPQNCLAAERLNDKSVSGLTPSLPELCGPSGRRTVPKNVNNASELSAGLNEPFRGRRQLKLKV